MKDKGSVHSIKTDTEVFIALERDNGTALQLIKAAPVRVMTKIEMPPTPKDTIILPSYIDELPVISIGWQITNVINELGCRKIIIPETVMMVENGSFGPLEKLTDIEIMNPNCFFYDVLHDVTEFDRPGTPERTVNIRCEPGSKAESMLKNIKFDEKIVVNIRSRSKLKDVIYNGFDEEER